MFLYKHIWFLSWFSSSFVCTKNNFSNLPDFPKDPRHVDDQRRYPLLHLSVDLAGRAQGRLGRARLMHLEGQQVDSYPLVFGELENY